MCDNFEVKKMESVPLQAVNDFSRLWNGIQIQDSRFLKFLKKLCVFLIVILILISFYAVATTLIIALISEKLKIPIRRIIPAFNLTNDE